MKQHMPECFEIESSLLENWPQYLTPKRLFNKFLFYNNAQHYFYVQESISSDF